MEGFSLFVLIFLVLGFLKLLFALDIGELPLHLVNFILPRIKKSSDGFVNSQSYFVGMQIL